MADGLDAYRAKRDFQDTPEPAGEPDAPEDRSEVRGAGALGARDALGPAPRARRHARLVGDPEGDPGRPEAQQPRGADRGPPARVPRLPRRDPGRQLRRRDDADLRPRHLRAAQVARQGGDGHLPRRARARQVRAVQDRRQELDDPPDGPAGGPGPGADAGEDRADARPASGRCPRDDDGWAYEIKWDGVRAIGYAEGGRLRLASRNGNNITPRYPELRELGRALGTHEAVLDGEVVALDENGRPELPAPAAADAPDLREPGAPARAVRAGRLHDLRPAVARRPLADGRDLRGAPRRGWPSSASPGPTWQAPAHHVGDGEAMLAASRAQGLEGIVAKRLDCPYVPGRRSPGLGEGQEQAHRRRRGRRLAAGRGRALGPARRARGRLLPRTASCATRAAPARASPSPSSSACRRCSRRSRATTARSRARSRRS